MAYITGDQHTININADERRLEIHPKMLYVGENLAPVLHISMGKNEHGMPAKKNSVGNPEYKLLTKQPHAEFTAIDKSTGYTPAQTAWTVDDASFINVHDVFKVIGDDEQVRVIARNNSTNITVARAQGTTASPASIANNTPIYRIGRALEEFSPRPQQIGFLAVTTINYCQIFTRTYGGSETLRASRMIYGKKLPDLRKENLIEYKKDIERSFLFGEPKELTTGGVNSNPIRYTGGLRYWINSVGNLQTGTTFTKTVWETFVENLFTNQDQEWKVVVAAPLIITAIGSYQAAQLRFKPTDKLGGMWAAQIDFGHGTIFLIRDTVLKDTTAGSGGGFGGAFCGFEPGLLMYNYLDTRDTHVMRNQQNAGDDGYLEKLIGEVGLHFEKPENARWAEGYTNFT